MQFAERRSLFTTTKPANHQWTVDKTASPASPDGMIPSTCRVLSTAVDCVPPRADSRARSRSVDAMRVRPTPRHQARHEAKHRRGEQ